MISITVKTVPDQIVYAVLSNADHLLWDNLNSVFVNPCSVDWDNFAIQCIEDEGITSGDGCLRPIGSYNGSVDLGEAGVFTLTAYVQVGASPDDDDDTLISSTQVCYTGQEEISLSTLFNLLVQVAQPEVPASASSGLTSLQDRMLRTIFAAITGRDNNSVNNYSA